MPLNHIPFCQSFSGSFSWSIIIATLAGGLVQLGSPPNVLSQSRDRLNESQEIEKYLETLKLDQLLIEFIEFETAQEIDLDARREKAARLAILYARKIISQQNPSDSKWRLKSELLLKTYPGLSTPVIRFALLQSRYLQSEKSFNQWWKEGASRDETSQLTMRWQAIKSDLDFLNRNLETEYQSLLAESPTSKPNLQPASKNLIHTENLLLQTNYLIGWTSYFLGILVPDHRVEFMQESDRHFREFLQIAPKKLLMQVSPSWIDFSSDWNIRALAGLAGCQRGLNRPEQSEFCFDLIRDHAPNQQFRDLRFVWDLNSRLYVNDFATVDDVITAVTQDSSISESGRIAFWQATMQSGIAIRKKSPATSRQLMRAGLAGLARDFQSPLIQQFMDENDFTADTDDFLSHWIAGYLQFELADLTHDKADLESARQHLIRAVQLNDPTNNPLDVACCRFLLARIDFHRHAFETSANTFLEVSLAFDARAPRMAVEAQWLAVRSFLELHQQQPRSLFQTLAAIDQLLHRFPGSRYAQKATFEKLRVSLANVPPAEAIQRLEKTGENEPDYAAAQHEILKIRFQTWLDSHRARDDQELQKRDELLLAEQNFQRIPQTNKLLKRKSALLVVDALLRIDEPDFTSIRNHLTQAKSFLPPRASDHAGENEYHYYELLFASRSGRQADAEREARWISQHAKGSRFELTAIIRLAQSADRQITSTPHPTDSQLSNAIAVFQRLVELSGSSSETLKSVANARVAFARLAELKLQSGQTSAGMEMLISLNQAFPNHQTYLSQLAIARTNAKQFAEAIPLWKKIATGVGSGTDLWFQSKQQLIFCLYHHGEKKQARQLYEQTLRLSPALPKAWQAPFDRLSNLLDPESTP